MRKGRGSEKERKRKIFEKGHHGRLAVRRAAVGLCAALFLGMTACGAANRADFAASPSMAAQAYDGYNGGVTNSAMSKAAGAGYGYATEAAEYGYEEMAMSDGESYYDMPAEGSGGTDTVTESGNASDKDTGRKLIRNVDLNVETKEFDAFLAAVEEQVTALGGYIESMNTYNGSSYNYAYESESVVARHSYLTARIPQKKLDTFLDEVSEAGHVISRGESVEDVTLTYVDMESRRKSLQIELNRLEEFLEKAETLEDIITLEDRMSTVRYQLESMESQLRTYDNMVDYSTVDMTIQEVKELTPIELLYEEETAWERLVNGFKDSLENVKDGFVEFGIWFVVHIPYLVVWAVVIAVIVLIVKAIRKKGRKKKAERMAGENAQAHLGHTQDRDKRAGKISEANKADGNGQSQTDRTE